MGACMTMSGSHRRASVEVSLQPDTAPHEWLRGSGRACPMDDRGRLPPSPTRVGYLRRANRAIQRFASACESRRPRGAGWLAAAIFMLATASFGAIRGGHADEVTAQLAEARDAVANTI